MREQKKEKVSIEWDSKTASLSFEHPVAQINWGSLTLNFELWEKLSQSFTFLLDYIEDYKSNREATFDLSDRIDEFDDNIEYRASVDAWSRLAINYCPQTEDMDLGIESATGFSYLNVDLRDQETSSNFQKAILQMRRDLFKRKNTRCYS